MAVASKWKPVLLSVGVVLALLFMTSSFSLNDNQEVSTPKHQDQNTTEVTCQQDPVACQGANPMALAYAAAEQEQQKVNEYLAALEAQRQSELAAEQQVVARSSSAFDLPSDCAGKVIPESIIWRESHCNYGSVNWGGCGGSNCYGMYQIAGSHWNGGACSDLNWEVPADQDECARRLSSDGTNLRPWGA